MIDTHTHLYLNEFEDGGEQAVRRALDSGINYLIFPNVDESTVGPMIALHDLFPDQTAMAMGLHPTEVDHDWSKIIESVENRIQNGGYVAVGEVGIDLYWEKDKGDLQKKALAMQIKIAENYSLPVIIHCREALDEIIEVLKSTKPDVPLIFHSFTGSPEDVKKIRGVCSPYFGINGVVTYKNAQSLREALHEIGTDKIVLETDSPYLSPVPLRGKRNESSNLKFIRDRIALETGHSPEAIEEITDTNARLIFGL